MSSADLSQVDGPHKKKHKTIDHLAVSESLGYRIFRRESRRAWSTEEDNILRELVFNDFIKRKGLDKYSNEKINVDDIDWELLSRDLVDKKAKDCRKRWTSSLDPTLRKGKWTKQEDEQLLKAYEAHGALWRKVANDLEGRTDDQCAKRYLEVLNPETKNRLKQWDLEEDLELIKKVKEHGTKWRTISLSMDGRPSLTCRNRWRKIMTDIAKNQAGPEIMKAIGVDSKSTVLPLDNNNNDDNNENELDSGKIGFDKDSNDSSTSRSRDLSASIGPSELNMTQERDSTPISQLRNSLENYDTKRGGSSRDGQGSYNEQQPGSRYTFQRQPLAKNVVSPSSGESHYFQKSPALTGKFSGPSRTSTEWSFKMLNPQTSEELLNFAGPISTQDQVHQLIELAKFNGVSLTVHQHIHHHYAPQSPVLDPVTAMNRYQHFNYLPPLTEVPRLTSSASAENSNESSGSVKGSGPTESTLMRLLNNDSSKLESYNRGGKFHTPPTYAPSPPSGFSLSTARSPKLRVTSNYSPYNSSRQKEVTPPKKPLERQEYMDGEGDEEEMDFWESMSSLARTGKSPNTATNYQMQNNNGNAKPVSQHHPLHYEMASNILQNSEPSSTDTDQRLPNGNKSSSGDSYPVVPNPRIITGSMTTPNNYHMLYYGENEDEEEEEDIEQYANHYGMFYNVLTSNKPPTQKGSPKNASDPPQKDTLQKKVKTETPSNDISAAYASGYIMPFNPS